MPHNKCTRFCHTLVSIYDMIPVVFIPILYPYCLELQSLDCQRPSKVGRKGLANQHIAETKWLDTGQATSHYLNQWWPSLLTPICITRSQRVKKTCNRAQQSANRMYISHEICCTIYVTFLYIFHIW